MGPEGPGASAAGGSPPGRGCAGKQPSETVHLRGNPDSLRSGILPGALRSPDALYLGYYLHLVQDTFFRNFIYGECHFDSSVPGNVEKLHHDYAVTNFAVAERYGMDKTMVVPLDLTGESINELAEFDVPELVREVQTQFAPTPEKETSVFTQTMAQELVERSVSLCRKELQDLRAGLPGLNSAEWSWNNCGKA